MWSLSPWFAFLALVGVVSPDLQVVGMETEQRTPTSTTTTQNKAEQAQLFVRQLQDTTPSEMPSMMMMIDPSGIPSMMEDSSEMPSEMPVAMDCDSESDATCAASGGCGTCTEIRQTEVGCSCTACECLVCAIDPFCCGMDDQREGGMWDNLCALRARQSCGCP